MHELDRARDAMLEDLRDAFSSGDDVRADAAASWLRRTGTPLVDICEAVSSTWSESPRALADRVRAHDAQRRAVDLLARLTRPAPPSRGQVLLVVPGGSRTPMGTAPLERVLLDAGFGVVHAPGAGLEDVEPLLAELAEPVALVLGLHDAALLAPARELVRRLRAAHPALRVVAGGPAAPDVAHAVGAHAAAHDVRSALAALGAANPLSPRELAVLQCVASGMSNPDAGAHLGVAPATVKTHLDRVFAKLGTSDRTATVALALRRGWIT